MMERCERGDGLGMDCICDVGSFFFGSKIFETDLMLRR